jgi:hypothetical protein
LSEYLWQIREQNKVERMRIVIYESLMQRNFVTRHKNDAAFQQTKINMFLNPYTLEKISLPIQSEITIFPPNYPRYSNNLYRLSFFNLSLSSKIPCFNWENMLHRFRDDHLTWRHKTFWHRSTLVPLIFLNIQVRDVFFSLL